jgi:hypothetical protein
VALAGGETIADRRKRQLERRLGRRRPVDADGQIGLRKRAANDSNHS